MSETSGRRNHGMSARRKSCEPGSVTDRMTDEWPEDMADAVRTLGDALKSATPAERPALWAALPPRYADAVVTYVTGIPNVPAHYAMPESRGGRAFVSLDALTPDTWDALISPALDSHGRPGVVETRAVADLMRDALNDVAPTWDAMTRTLAHIWLTDRAAVKGGALQYSAIARAAGLIGPKGRAPQDMRDAIARTVAMVVRDVETRAAAIWADESDDGTGRTLGAVRDVVKRPAHEMTPGQATRAQYVRDYASANHRDMRPAARDLDHGYPWADAPEVRTASARTLPAVLENARRTYVPRPGDVRPISPETRAALYGEHARKSQERMRAALAPVVAREWHDVTGASDRPAPAPVSVTVAPDGRTDVTGATSARDTLRAAFGPRR